MPREMMVGGVLDIKARTASWPHAASGQGAAVRAQVLPRARVARASAELPPIDAAAELPPVGSAPERGRHRQGDQGDAGEVAEAIGVRPSNPQDPSSDEPRRRHRSRWEGPRPRALDKKASRAPPRPSRSRYTPEQLADPSGRGGASGW